MDWQWLVLALCLQAVIKDAACKDITAHVNPKRLIQYVPERFLSMTIDPGSILLAGNLGTEALNMARSMSPCFVRLGGKSTNYIKFGKELLMENTTITEEQWDSVCKFASDAGLDLIASINPTDRINGVWDSRDALQLISYSDGRGYNVAWQLGYDTNGISASGAEVGRDIVRLRKILDGFSKFSHSPIFGPDLQDFTTGQEAMFVRDLLYQAGPVVGAIFLQPKFKVEEDPGETIMNAIVNLDNNVWGKALRFGRLIPRKPIWIAERETSGGGSEDALSLIKRLGTAARIGVQVVMRQVGPKALTQPTPEFWAALMYKKLVGRGVLDAKINSGNRTEIPIFSHCTQSLPQDKTIIDADPAYDKGAVTVFGVNESPEDIKMSLKAGMKEEKLHVYTLTFASSPTEKVEETYLNGQRLSLSPSGDLPLVSPRVLKQPSRSGVVVPARSVFFIVMPDVRSRICSSMSLVQVAEVRELSKKLIQGAADVLAHPLGMRASPPEDDSDKNQVFVKFGKRPNQIRSSEPEVKAPADTPESSSVINSIADSTVTADDSLVETTSPPDTIVTPINADDNCTADATEASIPAAEMAEVKTRRKRSLSDNNPVLDMEVSNNKNIPDQEELVKRMNSYAKQIYESSRSGGDIQITNIPQDIFDTLKRVKVTFKHLGTTSSPVIEESSPTEAPTKIEGEEKGDNIENGEMPVGSDSKTEMSEPNEGEDLDAVQDQGLQDLKDPSVYDEGKEEQKQRVAKQADLSDKDKEDLEAAGNTFRGSQNSNDGNSNSPTEGDKAATDAGSETEPSSEPARPARSQPEEGVPGDDAVREGDPTPQAAADEGAGKPETPGADDPGREDETPDESSNAGGDSQRPKLGGLSLPDTITDAGTSNTPESTSENNQDSTEQNAKLTDDTTENIKQEKELSRNSKNNEIKPEKIIASSILTTTEVPEVIAIEGVEPKKVDELLLKIAKSDANSTDVMSNIKKNAEIKSAVKSEVDELNEKLTNPDAKTTSELEEKQNLEEKLTDVDNLTLGPSAEEETNNNSEKSSKIKEEEEILKKGPEIPTSNELETVKVPRDVDEESEPESGKENDLNKPLSLVLVPTLNMQDEAGDSDAEPQPSKVENDKDENDDALKMDEAKDDTPNSQDNVPASAEKELNEKSIEPPEVKQLQVASFRDIPLDDSKDKSYTPETPSQDKEEGEKPGSSEVQELLAREVTEEQDGGADVRDNEEMPSSSEIKQLDKDKPDDIAPDEEAPPSSEVKQLAKDKRDETSPDEEEGNDDGTQVQRSTPVLPLALHSLLLPLIGTQLAKPSSALVEKAKDDSNEIKLDQEPQPENDDKEEEEVQVEKGKKEETETALKKKFDLKATGERDERRLKLLAIRNQIMEARERFKAAAREEGWRAALQRREEEMKSLLNQDRDKRKFIALPVAGSERTLLSRPRRLTYDEPSVEDPKEDYDYNAQQYIPNHFGHPSSHDYEKPYIPEQELPLAYNNQDPNHIIFPLDPKSTQAVVYNNRIIPAKLYGVISVNDKTPKQKPSSDLPAESFYEKFLKSYNSVKEKCKVCGVSEAPSLKPAETYRIPRDSSTKMYGSEPNFIPIVVLSPPVNTLRKKRSVPHTENTLFKPSVPQAKPTKKIIPALQKRSLEPEVVSYTFLNEIPKEGLKLTDSFLRANEIKAVAPGEAGGYKPVDSGELGGFKPINIGGSSGFKSDGQSEYKSSGRGDSGYKGVPMYYDYSPYGASSELGYAEPWSVGDRASPKTVGLPPLPGLFPPPPPLHLLPPPPIPHLPHSNYNPDPPTWKHLSPQPPQNYFFTMLQDKFKSLLGMLESLSDWCGANSSK